MAYNWDAVNAAIRSERARRKWSRDKLATEAGSSLGTIKNLEGDRDYKRIPVEALRGVDQAFGWAPGTLESKLRSEAEGSELENRYRRQPVEPGLSVQIVEDMMYEAFIAAAPDTPLSQIDKARRAAFEVLKRHGVEIKPKNSATSSGNEDAP